MERISNREGKNRVRAVFFSSEEKKTARTSQKEEEVGELPRATEVTGGRRSFHI